ncbi:hypothetical protein CSUI_004711 [Cystoisospora suis]|uniref:Uncharacterized protein n=1 Tax=Cystoisospora suis TaxID=483139 RepID=A0A2C6KZY3_9APIC|nr:hypothetical protein CSUI_004711 [Cystoisospora suis]
MYVYVCMCMFCEVFWRDVLRGRRKLLVSSFTNKRCLYRERMKATVGEPGNLKILQSKEAGLDILLLTVSSPPRSFFFMRWTGEKEREKETFFFPTNIDVLLAGRERQTASNSFYYLSE